MVMAYLDGTTVLEPANEVGRAHPRFVVAVIGNIIHVCTMSLPKKPTKKPSVLIQEDCRDSNSQLIVASRSYGAYTMFWTPIGTTRSVLLMG